MTLSSLGQADIQTDISPPIQPHAGQEHYFPYFMFSCYRGKSCIAIGDMTYHEKKRCNSLCRLIRVLLLLCNVVVHL